MTITRAKNALTLFTTFSLCLFNISLETHAAPPTGTNEIQVRLFDQPCLLSGPTSAATLRTIHGVSPEQIPPPQMLNSSEQVRKVQDRAKKAAGVSAELDRYLEQLNRYLQAQLAFFDGMGEFRKTKLATSLMEKIKPFLVPSQMTSMQEGLGRLEKKPADKALQNQTLEQYQRMAPEKPETEFHRAIKRMKIHYTCEFGEAD